MLNHLALDTFYLALGIPSIPQEAIFGYHTDCLDQVPPHIGMALLHILHLGLGFHPWAMNPAEEKNGKIEIKIQTYF